MVAWVFDASNIDPSQGAGVLPAGEYRVHITGTDFKTTKNGTGQFLEVTNSILDGPYKGRNFIDRFNVQNQNPQAVEIGMKELSALVRCVGMVGFQDTQQMHGIPYTIEISETVRADDPTKTGNEIVARKDAQGNLPTMGGVPSATTSAAPAAPAPGPAVAPPAAAPAPAPVAAPAAPVNAPPPMQQNAPPPAQGAATPPWGG